ncbi:MAG: DUF2752 domain-containing protein [Bacteroidales bacterium]|nr:DUF2752 domain-containing protein [Bacteroidales bacterium]
MKETKHAQWLPLIILFMVAVVGVVVYAVIDPSTSLWVPKCPFHILTGWSCPACGLQRSLHAMLHGQLLQALAFNYFFIFSIPYAIVLVVAEVLKNLKRGDVFINMVHRPILAKVYIVLFFVWGVLRNILDI